MNTNSPPPSVESLTQQRDQLRGWLARLGNVGTEVASHVAQRVRRDYEDRLQSVMHELSARRDSIRADLEARRAELQRAEAQRASAADNLEELRLRHLIGEIDDSAWEARRPGLESAVSAAQEATARTRAVVERLEALLREVGGDPAPPRAGAGSEPQAPAAAPISPARPEAGGVVRGGAAAPPAGRHADDTVPEFSRFTAIPDPDAPGGDEATGFDLSWLDEVEEASAARPATGNNAAPAAPPTTPQADDFAFLEELDRAIAASTDKPRPGGPDDPDRTLDADRAGMLLCKECGAINEPQLWYCEICGSEL
ncbi:MAG TPA: hypothetical protein VHG28_06925 [Longimicrobiaceae bacterium]|nr:hypothetical protein [Longimicrobiaceae bacterium]